VHEFRKLIGENNSLHLSGVSALDLLPFLYALGASSVDGSTPIQSAVAYGTIFNKLGKGIRANILKENKEKREEWFHGNVCECEICRGRNVKDITILFNDGNVTLTDSASRIIHNLAIWRQLIQDLQFHYQSNPQKWWKSYLCNKSVHTKKLVQLFTQSGNQFLSNLSDSIDKFPVK
jgi:queuine/archaeosine tRNA-ribosyltransferase